MGPARKRAAAAPSSALNQIGLLLAALMLAAALPGALAQCNDQAAMTALAQSFLPNAALAAGNWNTAGAPVRPRPGPGGVVIGAGGVHVESDLDRRLGARRDRCNL